MKKNNFLIWSLVAALCLMVVIAGVVLLRSYNANKSNQQALIDLGTDLTSVSDELQQTKALAETKTAELDAQTTAYQQQVSELQQVLDSTAGERDALQARVQTLTGEAERAVKDAQEQRARYDAASAELAKAETAAAEKEETLNAQIEALQKALDAATAAGSKDAEQSASLVSALEDQLKAAQAEVTAANEEKNALEQTVSSLKFQLDNSKIAADGQAKEYAAQTAGLNDQLTKAQTELNAANAQKKALDETIANLNTQLEAARQENQTLTKTVASLKFQLDNSKIAAQSQADASATQAAALKQQLNEATAQLDSARKEKEALDQSLAVLNEQLTAATATAGKSTEEYAAQVTALNEQLTQAQKALDSARVEKEALDQTVSSLNEQIVKINTDVTAAGKEKETLEASVVSLREQLAAAKAAADQDAKQSTARIDALNGQLGKAQTDLNAVSKEKEALEASVASLTSQLDTSKKTVAKLNDDLTAAQKELLQTRDLLVTTTSAMDHAGEEAGNKIAALEQDNQALAGEAEQLRARLEAETEKSARLQEELDVQSAQPEALQKRLETVSGAEKPAEGELSALAGLILRAFRESVPVDTEDGTTHAVPASVLIGEQEVMTVYYDFTNTQEAQAYEAAKQINESQTLYQVGLNHDLTAALVVNDTAFDKKAFEAVYAEVFTQNPSAKQAELNQLTAEEMTKRQVLREHAEALGIDPDAPDMEDRLWEEALKQVAVSEADFSAALAKRQAEEDAILAADPAQYARMLEEGQIASAVLPAGSRFVKQFIVPVDISEMDEILPEMDRLQKRLDEVTALLNGQGGKRPTEKELEQLQEERNMLARQVSQLNSDRKLLLSTEQRAKDTASDLALQIQQRQIAFDDTSALAQRDETMPAAGYAVFSSDAVYDREWTDAALALEKVGDVSAPIRLADGFHVLYYSEEITEASASIQKAQESLRQEILSTLRNAAQENLLAQWIRDANVVLNVK